MDSPASPFDALKFDNRFVDELPADPIVDNYSRPVTDALYSRVRPARCRQPRLLATSPDVARRLGLSEEALSSEAFLQAMSGNRLASAMDPYASCYGGHQFGQWAGQLGDGRAINLGEIVNAQSERWALQLKGAGPTPYSRRADGFAVLRSSLREFLCSEAMFHLGVPTTRALSLVTTGDEVVRDMLYDGNPRPEPGAVVCRVAPSFTRFGHFQYLATQGDLALLRQFVDYTLRVDFPHLGPISNEVIALWFREVCERTAEMIAHWMRVGFVHGVMNTDNMSILGLTIDYGPYGWLENYDPDWTPNTTDAGHKRYRYGNQPSIAHWNLVQLAQALAPLTEQVEPLQDALEHYVNCFQENWGQMMSDKLGLPNQTGESQHRLLESWPELLQLVETDMTLFFRALARVKPDATLDDAALLAPLREAYYSSEPLSGEHAKRTVNWLRELIHQWQQSGVSDEQRVQNMNRANPKYVLRNYLAQQAIDKAEAGDTSEIHILQQVLEKPYDAQPGYERFAEKRPDWARNRAGCSMLSCSS